MKSFKIERLMIKDLLAGNYPAPTAEDPNRKAPGITGYYLYPDLVPRKSEGLAVVIEHDLPSAASNSTINYPGRVVVTGRAATTDNTQAEDAFDEITDTFRFRRLVPRKAPTVSTMLTTLETELSGSPTEERAKELRAMIADIVNTGPIQFDIPTPPVREIDEDQNKDTWSVEVSFRRTEQRVVT